MKDGGDTEVTIQDSGENPETCNKTMAQGKTDSKNVRRAIHMIVYYSLATVRISMLTGSKELCLRQRWVFPIRQRVRGARQSKRGKAIMGLCKRPDYSELRKKKRH